MPRILLILLLFTARFLSAQDQERITIGLFWDQRPQSAIITARGGSYKVLADGKRVMNLTRSEMMQLSVSGNKVHIKTLNRNIGTYAKVKLIELNDTSSLNIKANKPKMRNRVYEDNFEITVETGRLKILNDVTMNNYLAGVVQWEAGNKHTLEFYKVQAIICRTYALKHYFKHKADGFNLNDLVDAQVYKGRCENDTIRQAVKITEDIVLVDSDIQLISALFHSNSGGRTMNSEDVWNGYVPYLRARKDPQSVGQPHYEWTVTFDQNYWLSYFEKNYHINVSDPDIRAYLLHFCPSYKQHYMFKNDSLQLTTVRRDFRFRSVHFCVKSAGDSVIVTGKGFGHGVGLSQEGAMKMAEEGKNYNQILHYYYKNVHLIKLSVIDFFREN